MKGLDLGPDPGGCKGHTKNKIEIKFHVEIASCSRLRDEWFSCTLNVLMKTQGEGNLNYLKNIIYNWFHLSNFKQLLGLVW